MVMGTKVSVWLYMKDGMGPEEVNVTNFPYNFPTETSGHLGMT